MRILATVALLFLPCASGQQPREFEVASIKPNHSGGRSSGEHTGPGTLTITNDNLRDLIKFAWDLKDFQIAGGPELDANHYDIVAKASTPRGTDDNSLKSMLQSLLADRFQLKVHHEKREVTGYSLVIAKKGPRLIENTSAGGGDSWTNRSAGRVRATRASMATLAGSLSSILGRPVIDNTRLSGRYDYKLEWAPEEAADPQLPSIFSALQEQLGLRLESGKVPADVLVIDQAERPSEN